MIVWISKTNIGKQERANLVVQLARFFYVFIYLCVTGAVTYCNVLQICEINKGGPLRLARQPSHTAGPTFLE